MSLAEWRMLARRSAASSVLFTTSGASVFSSFSSRLVSVLISAKHRPLKTTDLGTVLPHKSFLVFRVQPTRDQVKVNHHASGSQFVQPPFDVFHRCGSQFSVAIPVLSNLLSSTGPNCPCCIIDRNSVTSISKARDTVSAKLSVGSCSKP